MVYPGGQIKERDNSDIYWMKFARCRKVDISDVDFFFDGQGYAANVNARRCRAICAECPVRSQCLEFALRNNEQFGIWGGKTKSERDQILKTRRLSA